MIDARPLWSQLRDLIGDDGATAIQGLVRSASGTGSGTFAAGSLVVVLLWVYYSAQIFLLGAEFTKAYAYRHGSRAPMVGRGRDAPEVTP